jgi:outer membrane receptor protein involved in Fe transport
MIGPVTNVTQKLRQTAAEADLQGGLFNLPGGQVRFAAGVGYRRDELAASADPKTAAGDIIAGAGSNFSGATEVKEVFGELLVPLLKDIPFIKRLEVDVGFRYSDYSSVGGVWTYKGDMSWEVGAGLTLRGGYERAIRAPSVGELFQPIVYNPAIIGLAGALGSGDPCDVRGAYRTGANGTQVRALCIAQGVPTGVVDTFTFSNQSAGAVGGGNPALQEETADTYSVGAVWRPKIDNGLLRNLSISVDYYKIDLRDAIGSITAPLVLARCFNASSATNPTYSQTNIFCGLIERTAEGNIAQIRAQSLNLAGYRTSGIDVQVDWRAETSALGLPDGGELAINFVASRLRTFQIQSLAGDPYLEYAGTIGNGQIDVNAISRPRWKSNLFATYANGPFQIGMTWRRIAAMTNAANVGNTGTAVGVAGRSYFDINAKIDVAKNFQLFGSVVNVGNTNPPVYPSTGLSDFATYDSLGRYLTIGVKAKF